MTRSAHDDRQHLLPSVLSLVRAADGALLLIAAGPISGALLGRRERPCPRWGMRMLGARQLLQAVASGVRPSRRVLAVGGAVDALHAVSMLTAAVVSRRYRRAAAVDAVVAAAFAVAGARATRGGPVRCPGRASTGKERS